LGFLAGKARQGIPGMLEKLLIWWVFCLFICVGLHLVANKISNKPRPVTLKAVTKWLIGGWVFVPIFFFTLVLAWIFEDSDTFWDELSDIMRGKD
jgi:hypothetical protein